MTDEPNVRLSRALVSLDGLRIGDAYGNHHASNMQKRLAETWEYSDDTLMALSVVSNLRQFGSINQDVLAFSFASRREGKRGYGQGVTRLLKSIQSGQQWQQESYEQFEAKGSYGNGAAMRTAPVGAYFADNLSLVIEQARLSAEVTHAHAEGIAGAIAVALGTALAFRHRDLPLAQQDFIQEIITRLPESEVREGLEKGLTLPSKMSFKKIAEQLGNGRPSIAQRTVPFAIWAASAVLNDYETAIRKVAGVGGDVDTNCAIVGGIVVMVNGVEGVPLEWREKCEILPQWHLEE